MKIQFYRLPDEPVHISRLVDKDPCLLKFDYVVTVNTVFGYRQFVWLKTMDIPSMFLFSDLNSTTKLTNADLAAFAGNAIYSHTSSIADHPSPISDG
jgi:hypothetical protein